MGETPVPRDSDRRLVMKLTQFGMCLLAGIAVASQLHTSPAFAQCDGTWLPKSPTMKPSARGLGAMVFDSERRVVLLFGGLLMSGDIDGETWEWNGINWRLRTPPNSPSGREEFAMAYDSKRGV